MSVETGYQIHLLTDTDMLATFQAAVSETSLIALDVETAYWWEKTGERGCSLAALASRHLGVTLDKRWQRSDWSRRPLEPAQLKYAANDVVTTLMLYRKQQDLGFLGEYTKHGRHVYYEELPQLTIFE